MDSYWVVSDDPSDISHYGVKGMKWGVRKAEYKSMSRKDRKQARKDYREAKRYRRHVFDRVTSIHNSAADRFDPELDKMNKRYGEHLTDTRETYNNYLNEYKNTWNKMLVSEAISQVGSMPKRVTSDDILALMPTSWSNNTVDSYMNWYDRMYGKES